MFWLNSSPPVLYGCLDKQPIWSHVPPGHSLAGIDFFFFEKSRTKKQQQKSIAVCAEYLLPLKEKGTLAASWFIGLAQEGRNYGYDGESFFVS